MSTTLLTLPTAYCILQRRKGAEVDGMGQDLLNWLTIREVAERLHVSTQYVLQELIHTNRIHAIRTKLGWLVDPASVDAFERERTEKREKKKPKSPD